MFSEKPVPEWAEVLDKADLPHVYYITFAALVATIFSMIFPWLMTEIIIKFLANKLIPAEDAAFVINKYLPELHTATKDITVSHDDKKSLFYRVLGTVIKIGWAFCW